MIKRTVLQATGEVQKVGYRDFVQKVARKLGLVGYVENMRDGSVQIVCEGEESVVEEFKAAIKVKYKFIDVQDLRIVETSEPTGEFEYFDITRGEMAEELGERLDVSILYLDAVKDELKGEMRTGFSGLSGEMKTGFSDLKEETKKTHEKLDKMNDTLNRVADSSDMTHEKLDNIDGRLGDALERYDVFGEKMISIETEMKEFTKQITRLVDHLVETKKEGN